MKKLSLLLAFLIITGLLLGACGGQAEEPAVVVEEKGFVACQVTDVGGIDDKSFNATAWKGVQDAIVNCTIIFAFSSPLNKSYMN